MLFENPETLKIINENELLYFIKAQLESTFITEDWIAQHLGEAEIENDVIAYLNARSRHLLGNDKQRDKSYEVKSCFIHAVDDYTVCLLNEGKLVIDVVCYIEMQTQWTFYKAKWAKIMKEREVVGTLNVQLFVKSKMITYIRLKSINVRSEGMW
ncbi:hypothetical protein D3C87_167230 [compost metagenome]